MPFYMLEKNKTFVFDRKKFVITNKIGSLTKKFCKEKKVGKK